MARNMFCAECNSIVFDVEQKHGSTRLREYNNIHHLRSAASACEFCRFVWDGTKDLVENAEVGSYCKKRWGEHIWTKALARSVIRITHFTQQREHIVMASVHLNAVDTPGYTQGPCSLKSEEMLGIVCVHKDSSVAPLVSGRPFETDMSREHCLRISLAWYNACKTGHPKCNSPAQRPDILPKRLIEVNYDKFFDGIRVVEIQTGFSAKYTALSYCWGSTDPLCLKSHSLRLFSVTGVSCLELPATIRHACEVCRATGVPYLWVDSLCIVQDSEDDWLQESARMGEIYANAEFTIKASASQHCYQGIFSSSRRTYGRGPRMKCRDSSGDLHECSVRRAIHEMIEEPIHGRGWALQESLLSQKLLSFGASEIHWECRTLYCNESGKMFQPIADTDVVFPKPVWVRLGASDECAFLQRDKGTHGMMSAWAKIVKNYARRDLTRSRDKLPALSGVAKWFSVHVPQFTHDSYLAGIWKEYFPACLLWFHNCALHVRVSRSHCYRAPSWSWASLECARINLDQFEPSDSTAQLIDCGTTLRGPNKFGEVTDGYLTINAPLRKGWLVPDNIWPERFNFWGEDWKTHLDSRRPGMIQPSLGHPFLDVCDDEAVDIRPEGVEARVQSVHCLRITEKYGMLIEAVMSGVGELDGAETEHWRRLGIVDFNLEQAGSWWRGCPRQTLRLV